MWIELSILNKETEELTECPASRKNTLEKNVQKALIELLPKDRINAKQWIAFAEKNEQIKKTETELELI